MFMFCSNMRTLEAFVKQRARKLCESELREKNKLTGPVAHWISNYRTGGQIRRIGGAHISSMVDLEAQKRFASDVNTGMPRLMADQAAQNPGIGGWLMATEIHENHTMSYPLGGLCGLSSVA